LIANLRAALDGVLRRLSPKSVMAKHVLSGCCKQPAEGAIVYGTKRWAALTRFLDDGRLEIDNNIADVITKIANDWPAARGDELMPWNWQPAIPEPFAQAA
jgi:transposase